DDEAGASAHVEVSVDEEPDPAAVPRRGGGPERDRGAAADGEVAADEDLADVLRMEVDGVRCADRETAGEVHVPVDLDRRRLPSAEVAAPELATRTGVRELPVHVLVHVQGVAGPRRRRHVGPGLEVVPRARTPPGPRRGDASTCPDGV